MRRLLLILLIATFLPIFSTTMVGAAPCDDGSQSTDYLSGLCPEDQSSSQLDPFGEACENNPDATACKASNTNPVAGENGIIMRVVQILAFVTGIASVIMVILGGLKYITSNGDANAISSAKNTILYAVIGLAVFAIAQAIIYFVIGRI